MSQSLRVTYAFTELRETLEVAEGTRRSMQGNRAAETSPEVQLRRALWAAGIRGYRKNVRELPGKPDILLAKQKLAVFVHGCFWHSCPTCSAGRIPKTNSNYWTAKLARNVERDAENQAKLESLGYRVLIVWECQIKHALPAVLDRIRSARQG